MFTSSSDRDCYNQYRSIKEQQLSSGDGGCRKSGGFDGDAGAPNGEGNCDNGLFLRFKATEAVNQW